MTAAFGCIKTTVKLCIEKGLIRTKQSGSVQLSNDSTDQRPMQADCVVVFEVLCSKAEPSSGKALWCLKKNKNILVDQKAGHRASCSQTLSL